MNYKNSCKYIMAAACVLTAACTKAEFETQDHVDEVYTVILDGDCATKTSLAPETDGVRQVLWKAGDLLGLFVKEDGTSMTACQNVLARLVDGTGQGHGYSKGSFTTSIPLTASKTYDLAIYYPYVENAGSATEIQHSIPAYQTQSAVSESRHWGMSGSFAYATASFSTPTNMDYYETPVVDFRLEHKTSTMQLSLKASAERAGWKVKSVTLTAPVDIAGDVTYKPADDEFTLSGNGVKTITLAVPGGAVLSETEAADLYIVTFPAELKGKDITLKYTIENADGTAVTTLTHTRTVKETSTAMAAGSVHHFTETIPAADGDGWTYSTSEAFDLSAEGTSNCYIVSTPGKYSFDATVIGNGQQGILTPMTTTFFHTESATIAPTGAKLVWQTAQGLITDLSYADGRITFTKSADVEYGNALIAATDADGVILWSWHIWCTETGDLQTWVSSTGTYEAMDRNLGAFFASTVTMTDAEQQNGSQGLYYQWGRKDPFVGPAELNVKTLATIYDIEANTVSRPSKPAASGLIGQSITYTIKNPLTMIQVGTNTNNDWFATSENPKGTGPTAGGYWLWGNPEGYNYKSSTKPTPVKTIYDPCPPGYMVPPADFYPAMRIVEATSKKGNLVSVDGGATKTWIPLASAISSGSGNTLVADGIGYYWTSSFNGSNSRRTYNINMQTNSISCFNGLNNAYGFQVRCIQEIH